MNRPRLEPDGPLGARGGVRTSLARLLEVLQDRYQDDREVVRAMDRMMAQGRLRRLRPPRSRAA